MLRALHTLKIVSYLIGSSHQNRCHYLEREGEGKTLKILKTRFGKRTFEQSFKTHIIWQSSRRQKNISTIIRKFVQKTLFCFLLFCPGGGRTSSQVLGNKLTHYRIVVNHQAAKEREREQKCFRACFRPFVYKQTRPKSKLQLKKWSSKKELRRGISLAQSNLQSISYKCSTIVGGKVNSDFIGTYFYCKFGTSIVRPLE